MHVEDAAVFITPFTPDTLRTVMRDSSPKTSENLSQLSAVGAISNAATFHGKNTKGEKDVIGDATGKHRPLIHVVKQD